MRYATFMDSPIGKLQLAEEDGKLTHLLFAWHNTLADLGLQAEEKETPLLKKAKKQLKEYFEGNATYDEALQAFYKSVKEKYPELEY